MEHFYTLQGEGFNTGKPAYFIRLAGCDVGCVWCDVKESWDEKLHPSINIDDLIELVNPNSQYVVVTGGEPTLHNLNVLTEKLHQINKFICIETAGTNLITGNFDWICLSPKKFKKPMDENLLICNEFKVIVYNLSDFEWAESFLEKLNPECKLYLQPEWSKKDVLIPLIVSYVKENPRWSISLQTHKYINIP